MRKIKPHNKSQEPINYPVGNLSAHFKRYMKGVEMNKVKYYLLFILVFGISIYATYTLSMLSFFHISAFHSSAPCHDFIFGNGYTKQDLNNRLTNSILFAILLITVIQLILYFSLKQITKKHKYISVLMSAMFLIFISSSIYEGKEAGLSLIEQCTDLNTYNKTQEPIKNPRAAF